MDETYQLLQGTDPADLIWETVVSPEEMEQHLLSYNRESFRAAADSPLGNGLLYDAITFRVYPFQQTIFSPEMPHLNGLQMTWHYANFWPRSQFLLA